MRDPNRLTDAELQTIRSLRTDLENVAQALEAVELMGVVADGPLATVLAHYNGQGDLKFDDGTIARVLRMANVGECRECSNSTPWCDCEERVPA